MGRERETNERRRGLNEREQNEKQRKKEKGGVTKRGGNEEARENGAQGDGVPEVPVKFREREMAAVAAPPRFYLGSKLKLRQEERSDARNAKDEWFARNKDEG